ncbi:MAG: GntP family permease [Gemmataceae bacterium]|nr:GntP family permease [Gemmataceae bacterium]
MHPHPLLILVIAIAVVFVLIIRFRINAFLALIIAALTVGTLSPKVAWGDVVPEVTAAFGNVCGNNSGSGGIAIVIAMAAIIGQCLMESGAADKIVRVFVRALGERRAAWSLLISGYVLSVPVFFDTVFYLLVPLARAMRVRTGGNYLLFVMAICAGGAVTHTMVPPTPGPLAMADRLHIDLGVMILVGALIGVPMSLTGMAFCAWSNRRLDIPLRETPGLTLTELEQLAAQDESKLPGFVWSMTPIVLPVLLITANTLAGALQLDPGILGVMRYLGNPNLALLLSAGIALVILARQKGYTLAQLARAVEGSLASAGLIILITAAGGAFGALLVKAEVGATLGAMAQEFGMPLLTLGFLLAALLKIAQGSSTVAMITVSGIMAPLFGAASPGYHPVYLACAIGCGSLVGSWMNDSGFWVYKQMAGLTEVEALRTWTPLLVVLGGAGYLVTEVVSRLLPLI